MNIRYLGHSCFLLTDSEGTRVLTDPYGEIGYSLPALQVDAVTVSHGHYDHANTKGVRTTAIFADKGPKKVGGYEISAIESYHDEVCGAKRGENLIFTFQADGISVAHLGDLGEPCSEQRLETLRGVQVLLIPVGGTYTIDAKEAAKYVAYLKPPVVIPMHFKTTDLNIDISGVDCFLTELGNKYPVEYAGSTYQVEAGRLCGSVTKIIVMERKSE